MNSDEVMKKFWNMPDNLSDFTFSITSLGITDKVLPEIIRDSVKLFKYFIKVNEKNIVFVFPEKKLSIFLFPVLYLISSILDKTVAFSYNPNEFKQGEKLKFGNCIVGFDSIQDFQGQPQIRINLGGNITRGIDLDIAPYFQKVDTNRGLSSNKLYLQTRAAFLQKSSCFSEEEKLVKFIQDHLTHIKDTIYIVTKSGKARENLKETKICGYSLTDILHYGQLDVSGKIETVSGQLAGDYSIIISPEIYYVTNAIDSGADISILIVDGTDRNYLNSQLDSLDEIKQKKIPIVYMTDMPNSFELQALVNRGFLFWRWDKKNITLADLTQDTSIIQNKITNCVEQRVQDVLCKSDVIEMTFLLLMKYSPTRDEMDGITLDIYNELFRKTRYFLQSIRPLSIDERSHDNDSFNKLSQKLDERKKFISDVMFCDFKEIISNLCNFIKDDKSSFQKIGLIREKIQELPNKRIVIISTDRINQSAVQKYWISFVQDMGLKIQLKVFSPEQFLSFFEPYEITIVCGWLRKKLMRQIQFSYQTSEYIYVLYNCEQRWHTSQTRQWQKIIEQENNGNEIISGSTRDSNANVNTNEPEVDNKGKYDDIELLDDYLLGTKYRKYLPSSNESSEEKVEAIPITFAGDSCLFSRETKKIIRISDIVIDRIDSIQILEAQDLKVGDFIVIRESSQDIIKELADLILTRSGKPDLRKKATQWKDALRLELAFSSRSQVREKIQKAGCTRNWLTIDNWITDEDMICPNDYNDLLFISLALEDEVLLEQSEQIFSASREVKSAHGQAGRMLSTLLQRKIGETILQMGNIDPYNIWDPIEFFIDDIGTVSVLKIIDIGQPVNIPVSMSNRLLSI